MICFRLCCDDGHSFEGWFRSADDHATQQERGLIECPVCGTSRVDKALMAPAITRRQREDQKPPSHGQTEMPAALRAALQKMRAVVEATCDNVGDRFCDEIMTRQQGAQADELPPERGIYGTMTPDEKERLDDAGIDYVAIPWVAAADA